MESFMEHLRRENGWDCFIRKQICWKKKDQLQVVFVHVDNHYRDKGLRNKLIEKVKNKAMKMGTKKLYISATPSKYTVDFI